MHTYRCLRLKQQNQNEQIIYLVELILAGQSDPVRVLLQVGLGGGLAGVPSMLIIGKQLVARIVLRHTSRERIELIRRA